MQEPLMPVAWRKPLWLIIMVVASAAFSLGFACATPLAAFGAMASLTLNRKDAMLFAGAVWLANQTIGYAILSYPVTANSLGWGFALGFATLLAVLAAQYTARFSQNVSSFIIPGAAFVAAFVTYEAALFVAAVTLLGGTESFSIAIVTRILETNLIAMTMLLFLNYLASAANTSSQATRLFQAARREI